MADHPLIRRLSHVLGTLVRAVRQGQAGVLAFWAHRLSGLGLVVFLLVHVLTVTMVRTFPERYDLAIRAYQAPWFKLGEVLLACALCLHAVNGVRILILDRLSESRTWHRPLLLGTGLFAVMAAIWLAWNILGCGWNQPLVGTGPLTAAELDQP